MFCRFKSALALYSFAVSQYKMEICIYPDSNVLSRVAAEKFLKIGNEAIKKNGKFTVVLSGGSTPKSLYKLLTTTEFLSKIDWKKVFFFFGDERDVLPDAEESNFRMANENLLQPLQIFGKNIFRWQTEIGRAEKIAENYETKIKEFFGYKDDSAGIVFPRFDLVLLGMGDDGHTASLFPFTTALQETKRIAVANRVEKLITNRLTLTFPVINNSANAFFLVSGESKAEALKEVLQGEVQPDKFPAQSVRLKQGNLCWLIDEKAALFLRRQPL